MSGGGEAFDLLERIRETDEAWRVPCSSPPAEGECTVIETTAHAEANTTDVESDQGEEHDIEPACTHHPRVFGLGDAETVGSLAPGQFHEAHLVTQRVRVDPWDVDLTTSAVRQVDQGLGIELGGQRCIYGNAPPLPQVEVAVGIAGDELGAAGAFTLRHTSAPGTQGLAECLTISRGYSVTHTDAATPKENG